MKMYFDQVTYQETIKHPKLIVHAKNSRLLKSANCFHKKNAQLFIFDLFQSCHCVLNSPHPGAH